MKVKIRANYGLSAELKGRWYKFGYEEERELEVKNDKEKEKAIASLWKDVINTVEDQLDEVRKFLGISVS